MIQCLLWLLSSSPLSSHTLTWLTTLTTSRRTPKSLILEHSLKGQMNKSHTPLQQIGLYLQQPPRRDCMGMSSEQQDGRAVVMLTPPSSAALTWKKMCHKDASTAEPHQLAGLWLLHINKQRSKSIQWRTSWQNESSGISCCWSSKACGHCTGVLMRTNKAEAIWTTSSLHGCDRTLTRTLPALPRSSSVKPAPCGC